MRREICKNKKQTKKKRFEFFHFYWKIFYFILF